MTAVETRRFLEDAAGILSEGERADQVAYLGAHPDQGDVAPDSGGLRKRRWARAEMGKRGGARVITISTVSGCLCSYWLPCAKNEQSNLSAMERKGIRQLRSFLVSGYLRGKDGD